MLAAQVFYDLAVSQSVRPFFYDARYMSQNCLFSSLDHYPECATFYFSGRYSIFLRCSVPLRPATMTQAGGASQYVQCLRHPGSFWPLIQGPLSVSQYCYRSFDMAASSTFFLVVVQSIAQARCQAELRSQTLAGLGRCSCTAASCSERPPREPLRSFLASWLTM